MASKATLPSTRVFIDASVLFAAALSEKGFARDLIFAGIRDDVRLFLGPIVIEETRRNLAAKAPHAVPFFDTILALEIFHAVDPPASLVRQVATHIVLKDGPIVAGAIHAQAHFVTTYDRKHLLTEAALIQAKFALIVATPDAVLASI